jgi:hypothetical protein
LAPTGPNTLTIRSEASLTTFGASLNSGTQLTNRPGERPGRTATSHWARASCNCARTFRAYRRAASEAASIDTQPPSLPTRHWLAVPHGQLARDKDEISDFLVGDKASHGRRNGGKRET